MDYTLVQAQAFLESLARLERLRLSHLLGVSAVAAQGDRHGIEKLQRDLLKEL